MPSWLTRSTGQSSASIASVRRWRSAGICPRGRFHTRHPHFTTSPYVFTSFKHAQNYAGLREDQTLYVLVKRSPALTSSSCGSSASRRACHSPARMRQPTGFARVSSKSSLRDSPSSRSPHVLRGMAARRQRQLPAEPTSFCPLDARRDAGDHAAIAWSRWSLQRQVTKPLRQDVPVRSRRPRLMRRQSPVG